MFTIELLKHARARRAVLLDGVLTSGKNGCWAARLKQAARNGSVAGVLMVIFANFSHSAFEKRGRQVCGVEFFSFAGSCWSLLFSFSLFGSTSADLSHRRNIPLSLWQGDVRVST